MLLAGVVAIGFCGPGAWSVDHGLGTPGRVWLGPAAVAAGLVSGLVISSTRRAPEASPVAQRTSAGKADR
jgi:hypothetical protein